MANVPLIFQPLAKYADFQGRSRRSEFWLWLLFRYVVNSIAAIIAASLIMGNISYLFLTPNPDPHVFLRHYFTTIMPMIPLLGIIRLAFLIPDLAVAVRRLHDIGRTGFWLLLPFAVGIGGLIVGFVLGGFQIWSLVRLGDHINDAATFGYVLGFIGTFLLCFVLPSLVAWLVLLVFFITEGKRGPNCFGPDPKGEALNDTP